ncbi:MAG: nucleotidyltransferase family protein [Vicinamibacterales bacterium]
MLDLEHYQLFVFGSEVSGRADRSSDIDVGILGAERVPAAVVQEIRERLEALPTLRPFDVVDLTTVDEAFRAEALAHAERL